MPGFKNRLEDIIDYEYKILDRDEKAFEEKSDSSILGVYELLSVYEYIKTGDPERYRSYMRKITQCQLELFRRYESGNDRVGYVSIRMSNFDKILMALSCGEFDSASQIVKYIYKLALKKDLESETAYLAKYFLKSLGLLLEDMEEFADMFDLMHERFSKKAKAYKGYVGAFKAIYEKDDAGFNEAFQEVLKGHKILCRRGSPFGDSEHEIIGIWPLGVLNLARHKGLEVTAESDYIPKNLII